MSIVRGARCWLLAGACIATAGRVSTAQHETAQQASAKHLADSIVATAKAAIGTLDDSTALHHAGYFAIGFGAGIKDLTPFQGQHWIAFARFLANEPTQLAKPTFLMYLPVHDSLIPIGVAYTRRIPSDSTLPTSLAGVETEWHSHVFCRNLPGEGNALADGPDDCKARNGTIAPNQIAMVHAWTVPNPDGPYAHDNPALPFIATGLAVPQHMSRDERMLGLALGESYGAKLPVAHRIEFAATKIGTAKVQELATHRATLRDLAGQIRDAERAKDDARVKLLDKRAVDEYTTIAGIYRAIAPSAELRARFDTELNDAVEGMAGMAHHHM